LGRRLAPLIVAWLLLQAQTKPVGEVIVMTSGTYTAAHLELAPDFERSANITVTTATTSMGVGADAIPSRLKRGEPADVVIVADDAFDGLIKEGLVIANSRVELARSRIGMAVRAGSRKPDISSVDALRRVLLDAKSVALSSSVSGDYFTKELFPRLGIAEQMRAKTRRSGGERVGALIARGDAEIGFQQMSELLPIKEIEVVGPLPSEVQRVTIFTAGVAAHAKFPDAARLYVRFLASSAAAAAVARSGLELPTR
jgi:molybdate transport system substrate-binding protein